MGGRQGLGRRGNGGRCVTGAALPLGMVKVFWKSERCWSNDTVDVLDTTGFFTLKWLISMSCEFHPN